MPSNAISGQGATLQMSSGSGGAKTITAGAAGSPTILTSAAHGLANGDVVTIASVTGTMGTDATNGLNSKTFVISNVTTNTFCVQANTVGLTYTSGGTATPQTYTTIGEFKGWSGPNSSSSELDCTNLASTAKEFKMGLVDNGSFSFDLNTYLDDAGQTALKTAMDAQTLKTFKITLPSGTLKTGTFSGYVKGMSQDGKVDSVIATKVDIKISGAFVWS